VGMLVAQIALRAQPLRFLVGDRRPVEAMFPLRIRELGHL